MPEDTPPQSGEGKLDVGDGGDGSSTGGGRPDDACQDARDCAPDEVCAATFEGNRRGPFECRKGCIEPMDDGAWCADDSACCGFESRCQARGYCVIDGAGTGSGSGSGTGTGTVPTTRSASSG